MRHGIVITVHGTRAFLYLAVAGSVAALHSTFSPSPTSFLTCCRALLALLEQDIKLFDIMIPKALKNAITTVVAHFHFVSFLS